MTAQQTPANINSPVALTGIPAAPGLAAGPLIHKTTDEIQLPAPYPCRDPEAAWQRVSTAIGEVKTDLKKMEEKVLREIGPEEAGIFKAHQSIVEDVALKDKVIDLLQQGVNPEAAWHEAVEGFASMLENLPDPNLQARAVDVRDVGRQVLIRLLGHSEQELTLTKPAVIGARDLTPAETAKLDKELVLAFCTAEGGKTSHTAILAKALGIPAVVGLGEEIFEIEDDTLVLVDGDQGLLYLQPTEEEKARFLSRQEEIQQQLKQDLAHADEIAITQDGVRVEIAANIGGLEDAHQAVKYGAEAVGLFRTEFFYLDRSTPPSIEEQTEIYRAVIQALDGRPLVVRTLDIGGDKQVDYLGIQEEPNPFLGWRAVRMITERPEVMEEQLSALLIAGEGADLRIMIPLVSRVEEVKQARDLLDKELSRIQEGRENFQINLQFGVMVEVPSAALIIPQISPLVDFFSIGTNDLTQYTLAVDRMNSRVSRLASPFHPAVLQLISRTVQDAHEAGKWVGMCGEFAGEPLAVPFLLGVGLDEFSMAPRSIPGIKRLIRSLSAASCQEVVDPLLGMAGEVEVIRYLEKFLDKYIPHQEMD